MLQNYKEDKIELKNFKEKQDGLLIQHLQHILVNLHGVHMVIIILIQLLVVLFMVNICYLIMYNLIEIKMIHIMFKHIKMH